MLILYHWRYQIWTMIIGSKYRTLCSLILMYLRLGGRCHSSLCLSFNTVQLKKIQNKNVCFEMIFDVMP